MFSKIMLDIIFWPVLIVAIGSSPVNYVLNGGFQIPVVNTNSGVLTACPANWTCNQTQILSSHYYSPILFGQFVDMEAQIGGNLSQQISLPSSGTCKLEYYQGGYQNWARPYNCLMQIWWNEVLIAIKATTNLTNHLETVPLNAVQGKNVLKFRQIGLIDTGGTLIDNISITCNFNREQNSFIPNSTIYILAFILSMPVNRLLPIQNLFFILQDIWLYHYDYRNYTEVVKNIFFTVSVIQNLKFQVLSRWINISSLKKYLQTSDYTNYTDTKFLLNQGTSTVLIDSNFQFFILSVPQTILVCLTLYLISVTLKRLWKIPKMLRIFYFVKSVIIHFLLYQNLPYFVYVSFNHLQISFNFQVFGKIYLLFTAVFLFLLLIFSLTFFPFIRCYLKKGSSCYYEGVYQNLRNCHFLTWKYLVRGFLRGIVFVFFRLNSEMEMVTLGVIELMTLFLICVLEKKRRIFTSKFILFNNIIYHLLHFLLNLAFCLQALFSDIQLIKFTLRAEQFIIYSLIAISIITVIFDLFLVVYNGICRSKIRKRRQIDAVENIRAQKREEQEVDRKQGIVTQRCHVSKIQPQILLFELNLGRSNIFEFKIGKQIHMKQAGVNFLEEIKEGEKFSTQKMRCIKYIDF